MSILQRRGNGILVARGPNTRAFHRHIEETLPQGHRLDDDHLVAVLVRGPTAELQQYVDRAEATGMRRRVDFVLLDNDGKLTEAPPPWLLAVLEPSGNPPELEVKMEPEIRAMWQESRRWSYRVAGT